MNLVKSFGLGENHGCAVTDTFVKCWGTSNGYGGLGDGNIASHFVTNASVGPTFSSAAKQVAVGGFHSCVLLADQTVLCWGRNGDGQLGDNSNTDSAVPVTTAL